MTVNAPLSAMEDQKQGEEKVLHPKQMLTCFHI
jgi:hypothetical protein